MLAQEPALLRIFCAATVPPAGPVASGVQARATAHPGPFEEAGVDVLGQSRFTTLRLEALRHCWQLCLEAAWPMALRALIYQALAFLRQTLNAATTVEITVGFCTRGQGERSGDPRLARIFSYTGGR